MPNVSQSVRSLRRSAERSWNLYRLSRERSRIAAAVAHCVRAVPTRALTPEEQRWVDAIEQLRTEMNASAVQIVRVDYGARNPALSYTEEQMRAGVATTEVVGRISRVASKSAGWCRVLFELVRTVRPASCIEMGTAVGISAAYQGAALRLNGGGALATLEGAAPLADIARNNLRQLELDTVEVVTGKFADTLPDVLRSRRPVDYVFVDGHHDERATLDYFEQILTHLAAQALLVFDDIAWSDGMRRAWHAIAHDERVAVAVDLGVIGLCVIDRSVSGQRYYSIPMN